jgi:GNAT superfamily N-acetyltransferase
VDVVSVTSPKDLDRFVEYAYERYRNEPHWVPPIRSDEKLRLTPGKNPYFEHAEAAYFLAIEAGRVIGRVAATVDQVHNSLYGERQGAFGFFEAESAAATAALLNAAEAWVREKGAEVLRGPMSFNTNDECGLLIEGFDVRPMLLMTYSAREYPGWIEAAGLRKAKDLYAFRSPIPEVPRPAFQRMASLARRRDRVTMRSLNMKRFDEDLAKVKIVYNSAWERTWGFVPMTDHEIDHMAKQLKPAVNPNIVRFAEIDGAPVGFSLAIPDVNVALSKIGGNLFPFGIVSLLWTLPRIKDARLMALGVVGEYQKHGIGALLVDDIIRALHGQGFRTVEVGWTLEDNDSINDLVVACGCTRTAVYRIYEKRLAS